MTGGRRSRRVDDEAGVSIPEVLVSTLLLAIGVGGVVATIGTAGEAAATGRHRSTATELARGELETIRSVAYDDAGISPASPGYVAQFEGRTTVTETVNRVAAEDERTVGGITYEIERHVTWSAIDVGGSQIAEGYKRLTVIIAWEDGAGPHEIRLDNGRYGVSDG